MAEKFAFEYGEVSVAFMSHSGALGDIIIAKSVFEAVTKLVPKCKIDILYLTESAKANFKAFYGTDKNLNRMVNAHNFYDENIRKYDAALRVWHTVYVDWANVDRLEVAAPNFLQSLYGISKYNEKGTDPTAVFLRNVTRAHITGINRYTCLSCDGALPISDNRVEISLLPEKEPAFRELHLSENYITIGSNLNVNARFNLK